MKTLISTTAVLAAILVANTANAQFGYGTTKHNSYGNGQPTYQQTPAYTPPIGTWVTNQYPKANYPKTGYRQNGYGKVSYPKRNYPKYNPPKYNRTCHGSLLPSGPPQTGGMPWGEPPVRDMPQGPPPVTQTGVPQELQGVWFDISPEGNLWTYVVRGNSYDMFEVDPRTNQQVFIDGQPVQVENGPLTFANGVLHLSPGADVEEGPFNVQPTPDGSQLVLISSTDGPRTLTRQRRI